MFSVERCHFRRPCATLKAHVNAQKALKSRKSCTQKSFTKPFKVNDSYSERRLILSYLPQVMHFRSRTLIIHQQVSISRKRHKIRAYSWKTNRKWYVTYRVALFAWSWVSDLERLFQIPPTSSGPTSRNVQHMYPKLIATIAYKWHGSFYRVHHAPGPVA